MYIFYIISWILWYFFLTVGVAFTKSDCVSFLFPFTIHMWIEWPKSMLIGESTESQSNKSDRGSWVGECPRSWEGVFMVMGQVADQVAGRGNYSDLMTCDTRAKMRQVARQQLPWPAAMSGPMGRWRATMGTQMGGQGNGCQSHGTTRHGMSSCWTHLNTLAVECN